MKNKLLAFTLCFFITTAFAQRIETVMQKSAGDECVDFAISSDGLLLAKILKKSVSGEIEIWNTRTGHLLRTIATSAGFSTNMPKHVRFWKGSKILITGTVNGNHDIFDLQTGKLVRRLNFLSYIQGVFAVSEKTGTLAALHCYSFGRNMLMFYDLYSNTPYDSVALTFGGITALEFSPHGDKIAIGTDDGSFHVVELSKYNRVLKAEKVHNEEISFMQWTADGYLLISTDKAYSLWNLKTNERINEQQLAEGSRIVTSPTEDFFFTISQGKITQKAGSGLLQHEYGVDPDLIQLIDTDEKHSRLYVLTNSYIRVWDMKNIMQITSKPVSLTARQMERFRFNPAQKSAFYQDNGFLINEFLDTTLPATQYPLGSTEERHIAVSDSFSAIVSFDNALRELPTGKEIPTAAAEKILFSIAGSGKLVTVRDKDSVVRIYDSSKRAVTINFAGKISCGAYFPKRNAIVVAGDFLYILDAKTLKYRLLYDADVQDFQNNGIRIKVNFPIRHVSFSTEGDKLYAVNSAGQINIWNLKTFRIDTVLQLDATMVKVFGNRLLVVSNNAVIIMNVANFKLEARMVFLQRGDYVVSMADNYYKASRNGAKAIAFRRRTETFGFDQFDVVFNRPDIVTKKLGSPSDSVHTILEKLYKKRIAKSGFKNTPADANKITVPECMIRGIESIQATVTSPHLAFQLDVKDSLVPLRTAHVYVNGVPINTRKGLDLTSAPPEGSREGFLINTSIVLSPGSNLVEASVVNQSGIESAKSTFRIFYIDSSNAKPDIYFIGIGADNYKDKTFNLKYPSKDISDMAAMFRKRTDLFNVMRTSVLTNEGVSVDAVKKLKEKLAGSKVNDIIIIYWSGHGVLSKELDYYLATYDMEFRDPSTAGLPYSVLEDLLDDIPARKRLLFIDACHSGELDKENLSVSDAANTEAGTRSGRNTLKHTSVNLFALENEMFNDVRRGTGANVMSAAGGTEFALEGDSWGNGVFTYAVLSALGSGKADLNNDGKILISELQSFLQQEVSRLTNGRQRPTSRTENIVSDWVIW